MPLARRTRLAVRTVPGAPVLRGPSSGEMPSSENGNEKPRRTDPWKGSPRAALTGTGKPSYSRRSWGSGKAACQQFR